MSTTEHSWVNDVLDKSSWGEGPWVTEPDKIQWLDPETDLDCLIVRGPSGALCGYVGVTPEHPWHGRNYLDADYGRTAEETPYERVDIHGGLTFSDKCSEGEGVFEICHVPFPGRTDNVWWFGFDCAHAFDLCPSRRSREASMGLPQLRYMGEVYRDVDYVKAEVTSLAKQLKEAA